MKKSHVVVPAILGTLGAGVAAFVIHNEAKKSKSSTENDLEEVNKMVDDVQRKMDQISELAKDL